MGCYSQTAHGYANGMRWLVLFLVEVTLLICRTCKKGNENDRYAFLLIDVEMESCMETSRIKQAISSAQFYDDYAHLRFEYRNEGTPTRSLCLLKWNINGSSGLRVIVSGRLTESYSSILK